MAVKDKLIDRLLERLRSKTIKRNELTRRVGVGSSSVNRWMLRQAKPSGVARQRLEEVLDRLDRRLPIGK